MKTKNVTISDEHDPFQGLSVRAANICRYMGAKNKDEVRASIIDGRAIRVRTCGKKTMIELRAWTGVVEARYGRHTACPHCGGVL